MGSGPDVAKAHRVSVMEDPAWRMGNRFRIGGEKILPKPRPRSFSGAFFDAAGLNRRQRFKTSVEVREPREIRGR
jgi:hypothetical protein